MAGRPNTGGRISYEQSRIFSSTNKFRIELAAGKRALEQFDSVNADISHSAYLLKEFPEAMLRTLGIDAAKKNQMSIEMRRIIMDELKDLADHVVRPVFSEFAPDSLPGTQDSEFSWTKSASRQLKNNIRMRRATEMMALEIVMPLYGQATAEGRSALPDRAPGQKPYPIRLPGGQIIYRTKVGPATVHGTGTSMRAAHVGADGLEQYESERPPVDIAAGQERMRWIKNAAEYIRKGGFYEQLKNNIQIRIQVEVLDRDRGDGTYHQYVIRSKPGSEGTQRVPYNAIRRYSRDRQKRDTMGYLRRHDALKGRITHLKRIDRASAREQSRYARRIRGMHLPNARELEQGFREAQTAHLTRLTQIQNQTYLLGAHERVNSPGRSEGTFIPLGRRR